MGRIRVDSDTLRTYVSSLNTRINEYETLNSRLESLNTTIQSSWKGDAKGAFETMMVGYVEQTKQLGEILYQFRNYAQNAADKFDAIDAECATRIRGSF